MKDILLDKDSKSKDFYNIKELEETLKMNGKSEYDFSGKRVWMLLNIELWMKKILVIKVNKAIILAAGNSSRLQVFKGV